MVSSISATERVRLWNKFSQPFDHDAVKMEFFRRVHMRNPPFRIKLPVQQRDAIEIPVMVKYHYDNPPPLLPSLRDALRYDMVKRRKCLPLEPEEISKETVAESVIKDLQALQCAKAKFREIQKELGNLDELTSSEEEAEDDVTDVTQCETNAETTESNSKKMALGNRKRSKRNVVAEVTTVVNSNKNETNLESIEIKTEKVDELQNDITTKKDLQSAIIDADEDDKYYNPQIDAELLYLDVDLIKKLAYQRLQQLVQENPEIVAQYQNRTASKRINKLANLYKNNTLPSQVLASDDVRRLSIMFTGETSSILAQNASDDDFPQLHPALATAAAIVSADEEEQKYIVRQRADTEKAYEIATRLDLKLKRHKVRARAVLTPLGDLLEENRWFSNVELNESYFMRYRNLNIGYGHTAVDVNLAQLGYCSRISPKHATIFFDEYTKTYELINYSEYGSEVNGQLYTCDFTEPQPTPPKRLRNEDIELQKKVREILDKRRGVQRQFYVADRNVK